MKPYPEKVFIKNGIKVNSVYIVQRGDSLYVIKNKIKRSGDDVTKIEKINTDFAFYLQPGQFVFYFSSKPRIDEQKDLVLTYYENIRSDYEVIAVTSQADLKSKIKEKVGYEDSWQTVLAQNRKSIEDIKGKDLKSLNLRLYSQKGKVGFERPLSNFQIDQALKEQSEGMESVDLSESTKSNKLTEKMDHRDPASTKKTGAAVYGNSAFTMVLVIMFIVFFIISLRKSRHDRKDVALMRARD